LKSLDTCCTPITGAIIAANVSHIFAWNKLDTGNAKTL
jgi:hypothetical protein